MSSIRPFISHTLDLDRHILDCLMSYRPSQPRSQHVDFTCYISHIISSIRPIISHTLDLDRHKLDHHMLYRPSQPRSQDVDLYMLYHLTLYR